jgi:DNA mismatch repair protein MutH
LVTQAWYDEDNEKMSDFHAQLEMDKFLFVVFQKMKGSDDIVLKRIRFWNFPMQDIGEAEKVFDKTIDCINEGRYGELPKMSENRVAHVRPHGKDSSDTLTTPQGTQEIKRCFWLNAKYVQEALGI